jgi:4-hydroxy-tetrahydrodipicolinate reductase
VVRAAIIGISGRMGHALVRAAGERSDIKISAAVASRGSASVGRDAGDLVGVGKIGVTVTDDLTKALTGCDVAIDFSNGSATAGNLAACRAAKRALLVGTTGYAALELAGQFDAAAPEIPLLVASNTSVGITLLETLVQTAAQALPPTFDIEVFEAHHRTKRDAPSGTALTLGEAAAAGRRAPAAAEAPQGGQTRTWLTPEELAAARARPQGPRREGDIGFAVVRGGDIVGEHSVLFAGPGERITLSHSATDRAVFARGALAAAQWLARRPPGRYSMRDFIFAGSMA